MKTYAFKNGHIIHNGVELTHFSKDDDAIMIERREDGASDEIGADGFMMTSISADRSGKVTLKFQQTSPSNSYLMKQYQLQENGASSFIPSNLLYQDTNRQDRASCINGYILKPAPIKRGPKGAVQEWSFVFEVVSQQFGDPNFVGLATAVAETV